jgi:hypothetical protein
LRNAADGAVFQIAISHEHVGPKTVEIALAVALFAKLDAGGHVQEIADRRLAVFAALETGHIGFGGVVDRFDRAFRDCDANQYAGD